ncbi:DUF2569 family protein [Klebsiella aerogenes]
MTMNLHFESDCARIDNNVQNKIKQGDNISGWLYIPAFLLPLIIISGLMLACQLCYCYWFQMYFYPLGFYVKFFILFNLFFAASVFFLANYVITLFWRKKRQLPQFYIGLLIAWWLALFIKAILTYHILMGQFAAWDLLCLGVFSVISAIFIPYFLKAKRVQLTFVS